MLYTLTSSLPQYFLLHGFTDVLPKSHSIQVEIEYWKNRAAKLTLLVEQINSQPCKMTLVTLRAANCKLLKVLNFPSNLI